MNVTVEPTLTVVLMGEIVTLATFGVTVRVTGVLVTPSEVTVMLAVPGATPVAMPAESMVATLVEPLLQVSCPPERIVPAEFLTVAVKAWFWPTVTALVAGVTVMVAICVVVAVVVVDDELPPQPARAATTGRMRTTTCRVNFCEINTTGRALNRRRRNGLAAAAFCDVF